MLLGQHTEVVVVPVVLTQAPSQQYWPIPQMAPLQHCSVAVSKANAIATRLTGRTAGLTAALTHIGASMRASRWTALKRFVNAPVVAALFVV